MSRLVSKFIVQSVRVPRQENANDFDYCAVECGFRERVFADLATDDAHKNDRSSFLFRKVVPTDTIDFELFKNGSKVADINDDTFGLYYPSFASQPLQIGFVINWKSVLSQLGHGSYQFKAQKNILGVDSTFQSRCFKLSQYNDENADGTVRIETLQRGNIISSDFDYTDLLENGWYSSYRLEGELVKQSLELESERYANTQYTSLQIKEQVNTVYRMRLHSFPSLILNALAYDSFLADEILVTDYNIYNTEIFRQLSLRVTNFGELSRLRKGRLQYIEVEMAKKTEDVIKRRF